MNSVPTEDFDGEAKSLWDRFIDRMGLGAVDDEMDSGDSSRRRRPIALRFNHSKFNKVSVWLTIDSIETARHAADGLKAGSQQVVNLERAAPEIASRIIDFLNGVTYALDGYVEQLGDKVFMFTPANTIIEIENGEERRVQSPFQEN